MGTAIRAQIHMQSELERLMGDAEVPLEKVTVGTDLRAYGGLYLVRMFGPEVFLCKLIEAMGAVQPWALIPLTDSSTTLCGWHASRQAIFGYVRSSGFEIWPVESVEVKIKPRIVE